MASFKEAFATARKAGKKEFTWQGKKYNTKLKEETSSAPKTSPRPLRNPNKPPSVMSEAPELPGRKAAVQKTASKTEDKKTNTGSATKPRAKSLAEKRAETHPTRAVARGLKSVIDRVRSGGYSMPAKKK